MNLSKQFSWTLAQSGKVSVSHQQLNGIVMNKVHIQCDCMTDSLLSDIAHADMQGDHLGRDEPNWLDTELQKTRDAETAAPEPVKVPGKTRGWKEKVHVMRVKSIQLRDDEVLLIEGQLTLQGEDVIVRNGVSYFQSKSQIGLLGNSGPPILTGTQINRKRLEALAAKDGLHDFYLGNSELLDGQKTLIQNPHIQFGSRVIPLEEVAKQRSSASSIDEKYLDKVLPNRHKFINQIVSKRSVAPLSAAADANESHELNKVVLLNGRCILKDNYIVILRGLLHVGGAWHRVINGLLVGAKPMNSPNPVIIIGTPVFKDAAACEQLLLNNVTLSSRGSTVYAGNTPLLKDAVLHADGAELNICDLQRGSICGLEHQEDSEPARLFVQGGKFTVSETSLDIFDGTVWFRDVKVKLPDDSTDEVRVKDAMIFVSPDCKEGGSTTRVKSLFEGRDIIYKDNMLLLDDLTPLLKGGIICHEGKERPLSWLSSNPQQAQSSQLIPPSPPEPPCNRDRVLVKGTCIVDSNGIYVSKGIMIVRDKTVIIDKGIPLYSSEFPKTDGSPQQQLEVAPPRLVGKVVLDSDTARQMGAELVKGANVITDARLDIRDGRVIMNRKFPVMADCKLIFNRHEFKAKELGVDPESEGKEGSKESGLFSDQTESGWPQMVDNSEGGKRVLQRLGPKPDSIRPGAKLIQPSRTETEDSGRGMSDGADVGHRGTDITPAYAMQPKVSDGAGRAAQDEDSLAASSRGTLLSPEAQEALRLKKEALDAAAKSKQPLKQGSGRAHSDGKAKVKSESEVGQNDGEVGQNDGKFGQNDGEVGQNDGEVGQNDGEVGQNDGEVGQNDGEVGQNDGKVGQNDGEVGQDGAEKESGSNKGFAFEKEIGFPDENTEAAMQGPNSPPRGQNGGPLASNGPGADGVSQEPTGGPLGLNASRKSDGVLSELNGVPLEPNGGSLSPNSAPQPMQTELPHLQEGSQGGSSAAAMDELSKFDDEPLLTQLPKTNPPLASLEIPSAGIRGSIRVTARSPRQLVFSLQTRIEESLHFLDAEN